MKLRHLILASASGLGLALALLTALSHSPEVVRAWPPGRPAGPAFVKAGEPVSGTSGYCTQNDPCGSIQYAINESEPGNGDTIYVAGGTYTGTGSAIITITKSVTIYGGWDGNTGTVMRDPISYPTILDAENGRRVAYITGTVAPLLEGMTLQRGDASGLGGDPVIVGGDFGGAVYANNASPVITNCRILSSTAGFGGGLVLYYGAPTVGNNMVLSNTASQTVGLSLRGVGGGMFLYYSPATIVGNIVMSNVASGTLDFDGGGGLYVDGSAAVIRNNTIEGNQGMRNGGGFFIFQSTPTVRDNIIQSNQASYGCGGGLYIYQSMTTMRGNTILNNAATYGGGVWVALSTVDVKANSILDNQASWGGGGLLVGGCAPFTLTNNVIARNKAQGSGPGLFASLYAPSPFGPFYPSQGVLLHNTFVDNNSQLEPWMITVNSTTTLAFTNTIIGGPGGIQITATVPGTGVVTLDTTLWDPALLLQPDLVVTGGGVVISSTNYFSEPGIISPTYRLGPGSPAIDRGANTGVTTDIDGDPRPNGPLPDIGADEYVCRIYLPLVLKS